MILAAATGRWFWIVLVFLVGVDHVQPTPVATLTALLPDVMADFEINWETGDLATVSPSTRTAYLFRHNDLFQEVGTGNNISASMNETVCQTPVSISYKRFNMLPYYAVACTEESEIYIIDALGFTIVAVISIDGLGASSIVSSRNPNDPFYYYFYGAGHDSVLAAIDVRTMSNVGQVYYDSVMDGAVSVDGTILYIRGSWSPSGLESIRLVNAVDTTNSTLVAGDFSRPEFYQEYYEHVNVAPFVPDTLGQMTGVGTVILSRTLDRQLGSLDFPVIAWGDESKYIFGWAYPEGEWWFHGYDYLEQDAPVIGISVASYTSFEPDPAPSNETHSNTGMAIPRDFFDLELPEIPRGANNPGDFKRIEHRKELLPVDLKDELILAFGNRVSVIPYPCLLGEDVITLSANTTVIYVGMGIQIIQIEVRQGGSLVKNEYQVTFEDLPGGASFDPFSGFLAWQPTEENIGPLELTASLTPAGGVHSKSVCTYSLSLNVTNPTIQLPFVPTRLIVDDTEMVAAGWHTWDGARSRIALIPIRDGIKAEVQVREFNYDVVHVFLSSKRLGVARNQRSNNQSMQLRIFDISNNEFVEITTLYIPVSNGQSQEFSDWSMVGSTSLQVVVDNTRILHYDLDTFELTEEDLYYATTIPNSDSPLREGYIKDGILYNPLNGKPAVVLDQGPFPLEDNRRPAYLGSSIPSWPFEVPKYLNDNDMVVFYQAGVCLQLEAVIEETFREGETQRTAKVLLWMIDLNGNILGTKTVRNEGTDDSIFAYDVRNTLAAGHDMVYITFRDSFYWYSPSDLLGDRFGDRLSLPIQQSTPAAHFAPNQTHFCVTGEGQFELDHTVLDGEGPFQFFFSTAITSDLNDVIRMDRTDGRVLLEGDAFKTKAINDLVQQYSTQEGGLVQLLSASRKRSEPTAYLDDCLAPGELPVSLEIAIQAVDQKGDIASINYFVQIGVPYEEVAPVVLARQQQLAAQNSTGTTDARAPPTEGGDKGEQGGAYSEQSDGWNTVTPPPIYTSPEDAEAAATAYAAGPGPSSQGFAFRGSLEPFSILVLAVMVSFRVSV
ncbi:expressed unknown protein [Seminavis robusta]|uniref:Uncharacterized protein n=1 Tax=Seminavis robusta TaxID=568900 RepID=A0A9N8HBN8_9STRA|nr:expressed unknown protein [Seminavis robusta]|eukprot:Sro371_g128630.1 n/a (1061) ;mRNA; r:60410-63592